MKWCRSPQKKRMTLLRDPREDGGKEEIGLCQQGEIEVRDAKAHDQESVMLAEGEKLFHTAQFKFCNTLSHRPLATLRNLLHNLLLALTPPSNHLHQALPTISPMQMLPQKGQGLQTGDIQTLLKIIRPIGKLHLILYLLREQKHPTESTGSLTEMKTRVFAGQAGLEWSSQEDNPTDTSAQSIKEPTLQTKQDNITIVNKC